jgi:hypothetical protein
MGKTSERVAGTGGAHLLYRPATMWYLYPQCPLAGPSRVATASKAVSRFVASWNCGAACQTLISLSTSHATN